MINSQGHSSVLILAQFFLSTGFATIPARLYHCQPSIYG